MPIPLPRYNIPYRSLVRDVRPATQRIAEFMDKPQQMAITAIIYAGAILFLDKGFGGYLDFIALTGWWYFRWAFKRTFFLPFKMPKHAGIPDPRNPPPGSDAPGKAEGILYLGNTTDKDNPDCGQEIWFTNNDIRTHILYVGTTGSGKTEGLKSLVTNSLSWGSGYVYVDGKADTDLWASLYAVARRFGRDDDVLIINYMTGNSDAGALSNTMNPFSTGSSSYLANMITNFMPEAGGDNAMWKERAVALMFALLPALTYKRDHQGLLLDIGVVRDHIELQPIIRLSRDPTLPERIVHGLKGYLVTLPGFVDAAFDDEGNERPPSPDQPMYDLQIARQQHNYLSMQFTRSLQMLADEYSYIFKAQLADIEVLDVVLNRRILVTLIPALEKSGDEAANLGKIVAATLKGMMGSTLGNTVEGSWEMSIGSKQTYSSSSFMTVFDEVGYYTAQGMAVMAAQARSLGFSLVFATQDLPSMEKRVKQEAKSIVGNCNIKIFGRVEDPTETKSFLEAHSGQFWAVETTGMSVKHDTIANSFMTNAYYDDYKAGSMTARTRISYDHLRDQKEGDVHLIFADFVAKGKVFYVSPGKVKALRVHRFLPVPGTTTSTNLRDRALNELTSRLKDPVWTAEAAASDPAPTAEMNALVQNLSLGQSLLEGAALAVASLSAVTPSKATAAAAAAVADEDRNADRDASPASTAETSRSSSGSASGPAGSVTLGKDQDIVLPDLSSGNLAQSAPPLYEGDQYALQDIEASPSGEDSSSSSSARNPQVPASEADFALFASLDDELENIGGVMDVRLPDNVTSLLEQSALKLNKGLKGQSAQSDSG